MKIENYKIGGLYRYTHNNRLFLLLGPSKSGKKDIIEVFSLSENKILPMYKGYLADFEEISTEE